MKSPITLLIIGCISLMCQLSNAQDVSWAKTFGGAGEDKGRDIGIDQPGNTYVTGFFSDTASFGSITITHVNKQNFQDLFIAKFDVDGNALWAHSLCNGTSQHSDYPFGFSVNRDGYVVLTGRCSNFIKFDNGDSIPAAGTNCMFICLFDANGNLHWAKTGSALNDDNLGTAAYINDAGMIYCSGNYTGEGNIFGDKIVPDSTYQHHIYTAAYDLEGALQWVNVYTSQTRLEARDITNDAAGNIFVGGNYSNTVDFDGTSFTAKGEDDGFLLKLDPNGTVLWGKTFGSSDNTSYESGYTLATDLSGNVYLATTFQNDINFAENIVTTNMMENVAVASYDAAGNFRWVNTIKGNVDQAFFSVFCLSIVADKNIIVSGCYSGIDTVGSIVLKPTGPNSSMNDAFFAAFSPVDGDVEWAVSAGGNNIDANYGMVGADGYIYAAGLYNFHATFGSTTLVSDGKSDIYLLKVEEQTATGIGHPSDQSVMVFPNPASGELNVIIPSSITTLKLIDAIGRVVLTQNVQNVSNEILDLNQFNSGAYYLQLSGDSKYLSTKILIQN